MDVTSSLSTASLTKKEDKFKKRLERILKQQDLTLQRDLILRVCQQLEIDLVDCAAALVLLSQSNLYPTSALPTPTATVQQPAETEKAVSIVPLISVPKMICYRVEVGAKHEVTEEAIKAVFVKEAGVDIKMIGKVTIHFHYTLIELPEGMPTDIYHLLTTVSLQQQKLNIKRLKLRDRSYSTGHLRRKR